MIAMYLIMWSYTTVIWVFDWFGGYLTTQKVVLLPRFTYNVVCRVDHGREVMTKTRECLTFLAKHQPLADQPDEQSWSTYIDCIDHLGNAGHPECIPLLLGSMGDFEDMQIYESIQYALRQFPAEMVIPQLLAMMARGPWSVRLWCTDAVRAGYRDPVFLPQLARWYPEGGEYFRLVAAAAIEAVGTAEAVALARELLAYERAEAVREILEDLIARFENAGT